MVSKIFCAGLIVNFALTVAGSVVPRVPAGTQFITGACTSDADCASGCCGFNTGKCAGAIVALQRDGGCGFGATPNDNAAQKLGFTGGITSASTGPAGNNAAAAPAAPPGTQFITGACTSDADCASGCCGFRTGKCAGAIIALQRDGGCGFGSGTPNDNAAKALGFTGGITSRHVDDEEEELDARAGTQFITGPCASDGDCASGCCGFNTGKCAGAIIALQRDGGCGFGATPNDNAARLLGFTGGITSPSSGPAGNNAAAPAAAASAAPASAAPGTQFITGPCASDADCASGCCGFRTGKCAGAIIALQRDGGCGFGSSTPNDNAAKALGFTGGITSRKMHRSVFAN
ncbi:hypothetical protein B0H10DRAFT_2446128 [Mycena sp. CBHHK59/15]|nr:hypothetical protein B0H10DRAFT_2446128 [Mycena sp. CBHHK59/15]